MHRIWVRSYLDVHDLGGTYTYWYWYFKELSHQIVCVPILAYINRLGLEKVILMLLLHFYAAIFSS